MRLTVVGCSGSFPGPDSAGSCYLVESAGFALVLDLGSGAIGPLQRYVDLAAVDAVLVSHAHADHCADLGSLYVAGRYHPDGQRSPVPIYGPEGLAEQVTRGYGGVTPSALSAVLDFREVEPGKMRIGPFDVTLARTAHPVPCHAIRLEADGGALVYTADTGPSDAVTSLAIGADLLLAEASYPDAVPHPPGLHLTGREAGEMARTAGVGQLVITHVPPWYDAPTMRAEAADALGRDCLFAVPGARFEVP